MSRVSAEVLAAIVLLAVLAGAAWAALRQRARRTSQLATFARAHGLRHSPADHTGLLDLPFSLLHKGAARGCGNVIWGRWRGLELRCADYWYQVPSAGESGRAGGPNYGYFSIAAVGLGLAAPHLEVSKGGRLARLARLAGSDDIDFGSGSFGRQFRVRSPDRGFALLVIDAIMMEWLLSTGGRFGFEMAGNWLLTYCERLAPAELPLLLDAAAGFVAHLPRVLFDAYRSADTTGPGTDA